MEQRIKELCFKFPVITQEELQAKWNHPIIAELDKKRLMLISTMISTQDGKFYWHSSVRVCNKERQKVKEREFWMASEKFKVESRLLEELNGVGVKESASFFDSKFAMHYTVPLDQAELDILEEENPNIKAAKIVPYISKTIENKTPVPTLSPVKRDPNFDPDWLLKKR